MEVREEKEVKKWGRFMLYLPFVQGCQSRRLCLVFSFGSRWPRTTELGSVWRILPDAPEPLPGEGRPERGRCCGGHGGAYLEERQWRAKEGKIRG